MDPRHLAPTPLDGEKKQRAIQDAGDMASFVTRSAERANCPIPPYEFLELIGKGGSGRVYKCRRQADGEFVAVKIIDTDSIDYRLHVLDKDETIRDFKKEVGILHQLKDSNAKNVNMIHDAFSFQEQLWIVCDYCTGGSVRTLLRACVSGLAEEFIIPIARELALAVKSVHNIGIIHRDVKCTNVYVNERGDIQLGDFGIVGVTDDGSSKRRTIVGTPHYMPPELLRAVKLPHAAEGYGKEVDIWSYGCSIYEMATGLPPNAEVNPRDLIKGLRGAPRLEGEKYSQGLRDFVAFCLDKDAVKRPTAEQILTHPYIANTEQEYPTSSLVQLIEQYKLWELDGGQRHSLFIEGGAPAVPTAEEVPGIENDDDWNFSTSDDFNVAFEKRFSQMIERHSTSQYTSGMHPGANLPRLQTQDLRFSQIVARNKEIMSANRGEQSLQRLWNPHHTPYELHTPIQEEDPLPSAQSAPERDSQVMIDLDEVGLDSVSATHNWDFSNDLPTIKARQSDSLFYTENDTDDSYQYSSMDEPKRATMEWTFPKKENRATMEWKFPKVDLNSNQSRLAELDLAPLNEEADSAQFIRPPLKHTTTVPIGQFGDFMHSTPVVEQTSSSPIRESTGSLIDLDFSIVDARDIERPSTAVSASGSTMTDITSGNPFDLEEEPDSDRNRTSYHKPWQSEGGQVNRNSYKNVPMHLRGSSLSSTDSEHDPIGRRESDTFDRVPKRPLHLSRTRRRHEPSASDTTDTENYWPDFPSANGTFDQPQLRRPEVEFPPLTAPHPESLGEGASTQHMTTELTRLLDDFTVSLITTSKALSQATNWDERTAVLEMEEWMRIEELELMSPD